MSALFVGLHGFGGSPSDWEAVARALESVHPQLRLFFPSLPGHQGGIELDHYGLPEMAYALIEQLPHDRPIILAGYSLGGRIAMHIAQRKHALVHALLLLSASPGLIDPEERQARLAADNALAKRLEGSATEYELRKFWADWAAQPVFGNPARSLTESEMRARFAHSPHKLSRVLRDASPGVNPPLHKWLARWEKPLAYFAGEMDTKYLQVAQELRSKNPSVLVEVFPRAGHALLRDAPLHVAQSIGRWISALRAL